MEVRAASVPEVFLSRARLEPRFLERGAGEATARFDVAIEHYAGEAELLVLAGGESRRVRLDIAPAPGKLGREEHRFLLEALESRVEGLLVGFTGGAVQAAEAGTGHAAPPLVRYARFRARMEALLRAFAVVEDQPHRALVTRREERVLHRVRRPDLRTVRSVLSRPRVIAALRGEGAGTCTVDHPLRVETFDTPVNRHVKAVLLRLLECVRGLETEFARVEAGAGPGRDSDEARARARTHRGDCGGWATSLLRALRAPFLDAIRAEAASGETFQVVAWHPAYQRLDRTARSILTPRVPLVPAGLPLPLRPTYDLYELWCLFEVEEGLRQAIPDARWSGFREFVADGVLLGKGGERVSTGALPGGGEVQLLYQPTFQAFDPSRGPGERTSITGELRPDFVVRWVPAGREQARFLVLDAKYRASRDSIHEALRSLHVYRDALRWNGLGPVGAFALCPAVHEGAAVYSDPEYVRAHRIGVQVLHPRRLTTDPQDTTHPAVRSAMRMLLEGAGQ